MTTRRRRRKDEEEPAEVRHTYMTMMMILMIMMICLIMMIMLTIQAKAGADQSKLGVETNISPLTNFTTRLEKKNIVNNNHSRKIILQID